MKSLVPYLITYSEFCPENGAICLQNTKSYFVNYMKYTGLFWTKDDRKALHAVINNERNVVYHKKIHFKYVRNIAIMMKELFASSKTIVVKDGGNTLYALENYFNCVFKPSKIIDLYGKHGMLDTIRLFMLKKLSPKTKQDFVKDTVRMFEECVRYLDGNFIDFMMNFPDAECKYFEFYPKYHKFDNEEDRKKDKKVRLYFFLRNLKIEKASNKN